jgi:hypothetical protein
MSKLEILEDLNSYHYIQKNQGEALKFQRKVNFRFVGIL